MKKNIKIFLASILSSFLILACSQKKEEIKDLNTLLVEYKNTHSTNFERYIEQKQLEDSTEFAKFKIKLQNSNITDKNTSSLEEAVNIYKRVSEKYASNIYIKGLKSNMLTTIITYHSFQNEKELNYLKFLLDESIKQDLFISHSLVEKCAFALSEPFRTMFIKKQIQLSEMVLKEIEEQSQKTIPSVFDGYKDEIEKERSKIKIRNQNFEKGIEKIKSLLN